MSRKLMRASPLNLEGVVRDRLAYKIAKPLDNALANGSGNNQPLGIFTQTAVGAAGIDTSRDTGLITSSAIDPDKLITLRHTIRDVYTALKSCRWAFHRTVLAAIRKLKASTGVYLWSPAMGLTGPVPGVLLDLPYTLDENAPSLVTTGGTRLIVLGAMEYIWTATALDITVQRLDELYAATNQVGYIIRAEIDGMPTLADAFVCGTAS
jgi:HK97 family phage major capsid protein